MADPAATVITPATVRDYGDSALLLEFHSTTEVLAYTAMLAGAGMPGVIDIVPAASTVLLVLAQPDDRPIVRLRLARLPPAVPPTATTAPDPLVLPVVYDGADLQQVAALTGLTPAEVIAAHTRTPWQVAFGGFTPGFAYLVGGDPRLAVPRLAEPRTRVPPGAVGLAGEFSGIYPRESPGGWQLIGHTDAVLWDPYRASPALLTPGIWVQFADAGVAPCR